VTSALHNSVAPQNFLVILNDTDHEVVWRLVDAKRAPVVVEIPIKA
jgi:hypothetical protein